MNITKKIVIISILFFVQFTQNVFSNDDSEIVGKFGQKISTVLASKQLDEFMNLLPKEIIITDGSDYETIKSKFQTVFEKFHTIETDSLVITQSPNSKYEIKILLKLLSDNQEPYDLNLYFTIKRESEEITISDIYDENDLMIKNAFNLLTSNSEYNNNSLNEFIGFSYMDASDSNLINLKEKFELKKVAGHGGEISKIINLMKWAHHIVQYDGNSSNPTPRHTLNIVKVCEEENRGVNCRMMATILNEVYLAMGFKSRFITCLPIEEKVEECHVVNIVYSKTMDKWIYMDPSFEAYFMDENGVLLSPAEIRERIIHGDSLWVNDEINVNCRPYGGGKSRYIKYMTKNLLRFSCPVYSAFGCENIEKRSYINLIPTNHSLSRKPNVELGKHFTTYFTCNPDIFWALPVN